jgi:hypothetical protein
MNNIIKVSLIIAGGLNVFFLIFHAFILQPAYQSEASAISADCRTLNLGAILMVGMMAYFTLFRARELVEVSIGKPLLIVFSLFYLVRIAAEFIFYGYQGLLSLIIIALCAVPALIYLYPLIRIYPTRKYDAAR